MTSSLNVCMVYTINCTCTFIGSDVRALAKTVACYQADNELLWCKHLSENIFVIFSNLKECYSQHVRDCKKPFRNVPTDVSDEGSCQLVELVGKEKMARVSCF
jgi:hypothetical protein